ncbi:hypothetical protein BRD12_02355 [Halobacteriales archaeon SW_12_67_38]|jgi:predicted RNA-binding protein with PUA domain|nr:MAG: hypothetical protein BRC80_06375 [Halobacteriales archaeon QH_9_66_26]PSQ53673.1 MAG: hypothetical protein BRD12_02355 [Halobacteriales archaeon SW_12_67_38]PSQ64191.1 MAG: hypothetical protein BRD24_11500 [Halobacteriales archaeon SW_9_67_24]
MAHVPERTELYVCLNCQAVLAGDVSEGAGEKNHNFSVPDECAACGNTDIVELSDYPHVE